MKHLSFGKNFDILKNYAAGVGFKTMIENDRIDNINEDLKKYDARLGFNHDEEIHMSYGIWFDSEEQYTWFVLKWS